jgi:hypothetical protein
LSTAATITLLRPDILIDCDAGGKIQRPPAAGNLTPEAMAHHLEGFRKSALE